jgi:hypothetical protein
MKIIVRLLYLILAFCSLVYAPKVGFTEDLFLEPGKGSLPSQILERMAKEFPQEKSLPTDLSAMIESYPGFCQGVEFRQDRKIYFIIKNHVRLIYDDGLVKDFETKLDKPDLKDMLDQLYRPGVIRERFQPDHDPGRFRVDGLFNAVYGDNGLNVKTNLVPVSFCGTKITFNAQNGAAKALESVGQELSVLLKSRPELRRYVFPLGGTFLWRKIAGTSRLSPHSWGIAIDLNPRLGAYWRGAKKRGEEVEMVRNQYPQEIVEIFEKHGFIWGGKWSHFDLMHFEYRPELFQKWRLDAHLGR